MPTNPFFSFFEQAWNDHQTGHGQHSDPCAGLPLDQIQDQVATWLAGFNPLIESKPETAAGIQVGILQRLYE